ncbi:Cas9 inhibitor AcrIIA9 family protein, partial [Enterococcus gallinarum]|uniref:Cas9 inhibitor AcrIIA9 family protein n=1 Tax=Enterococcus gallinarum TaxID=1353 RepID=UPI003D10ED27
KDNRNSIRKEVLHLIKFVKKTVAIPIKSSKEKRNLIDKQGILTPEKSLKKAHQYAYSQAVQYQVGGCAIIDHELVYLWIAHYFKQPVTVVTNDFAKEMVQKSKPKKEEPKKPQNINQVKPKKKETKKTNSTKDKTKMMEGEQLSLLDML